MNQPDPDLRDRIVADVQRLHDTGAVYALNAGEPERIADAVLAVLPAPADRAVVRAEALREAADRLVRKYGVTNRAAGLLQQWAEEERRLAGEMQQDGAQS